MPPCAQLFNEREEPLIATLCGVATTGSLWQFLTRREKTLTLDRREYYIERIAKIWGILMWMMRTAEDALVQSEPDTYSPPLDSRTILTGVEHRKGYSEAGWLLQLPDVLPERIVRERRCFPVW
jgi:hypothetical protein